MTIVTPKLCATDAIAVVLNAVQSLPVFVAGSAVAASVYSNVDDCSYDDVDAFCATQNTVMAAAERLLHLGFTLDERMAKVYNRWLKYGNNGWHTNSLKLERSDGLKVNLVYKTVGRSPVNSLAQVIESFDFGLLAVGYDASDGAFAPVRDMRGYLFPGHQPSGALPLMPNKRDAWRQGLISQYNGIREVGRYAKYAGYGFDMSLVKDDLVVGYWNAAAYLANRTDHKDKVLLGQIYESIAMAMEVDDIDKLSEAGREILYMDSLDEIMEALE